jgi:hypothetical protein
MEQTQPTKERAKYQASKYSSSPHKIVHNCHLISSCTFGERQPQPLLSHATRQSPQIKPLHLACADGNLLFHRARGQLTIQSLAKQQGIGQCTTEGISTSSLSTQRLCCVSELH